MRLKKKKQLNETALTKAAECLKALAHPKRLQMLYIMSHEVLSVGELANRVGILSHVASEQLRLLERCGLVSARKEGQIRYYQIAETHLLQLLNCLESKFSEETA
jgi:DNA-binding transcriptional ArsR family regulator